MKEKTKKRLYKWFNLLVKGLFIVLIVYIFEYNGMIGIGIYYLLYSLYACWIGREHIINLKYMVETAIWGKPLKMFKKGELKNTKVKIQWSDKNVKTRTSKCISKK